MAVCPPGGWLPDRLRAAGVPAVEMPMRGPLSPTAVVKLIRLAREHHIDLIHSHLTRATYLGYFTGMLGRLPVISTVHVLTRDFAYHHLPGRNHRFVAVSDHIRQSLIARGLPPGRVETVYNGSDITEDRIVPAGALSVRAELGLPAEADIVGLVGRVDTFKGHHILVRAAREIVDACPRAYFVFVGHADPGLQQTLWEMASAGGMDDRLRFTGVRNDVARLIDAMDVVTLPSISEACSMAIIEAMSLGKAVVATRAGGNLELVQEATTGLLVERTPEALSAAVIRILRDPGLRASMGSAGQERARAMFSVDAMTQRIESIYQSIVASRAPQHA